MRLTHFILIVFTLIVFSQQIVAQDIIGKPTTGANGITVPVSELIRQTTEADRLPKTIRYKEEFEARRRPLENPDAPKTSQWPIRDNTNILRPESITATQTIHSNFLGITISESLFIPPDSNGDVGTTQVCLTANGRIKFYNRNTVCDVAQTTAATGTTPLASPAVDLDMDVFFNSVRNGSSISDPHVRFDRLTSRWFIVAINVASSSNRCVIAVSNGPTVTGTASFTYFFFVFDAISLPLPGTPGYAGGFFDYPTLGVDANALYIGSRMFTSGGSYLGATLFIVRKTSLTSGGPIVTTAFHLNGTTSTGTYTPQGVDNDDAAATEGYFIGVDMAVFSSLVINRITTPGGTPAVSSMNLTVPTTISPQAQPQNGSPPRTLDALDDRLFAAMIRKNKINGVSSLWTAHNIEVNTSGVASSSGNRNGSRWYQVDNMTTTPTLTQSGTLFDAAVTNPRGFWIPSIATSGQGHSILGFSSAASNQFADCGIAGRYSTDASGTLQSFVLATTSASHYDQAGSSPERWGDFSQVIVDPLDDMTMWTFQEYCNGTDSWGVRAIQLIAPAPASPTSPGTIGCGTLISGVRTTSVMLNGTSSNNSGFYDPGSGYNRLNVTTTGSGTSINNIVFNSPTQIQFDVSWPVALAGTTQTLTITNPDCQFVNTTYTLPAGCVIVPVRWLTFTGRDIGRRVELNWRTDLEEDNLFFEIERRNPNGQYLSLGRIASKGVNGGLYSFIDDNPSPVNFYRLRQVNIAGTFSYSIIVMVEIKSAGQFLVYPNPANDRLNIELPPNFVIGKMNLVNNLGELIYTARIINDNKLTVDLKNIAAGNYVVEIESATGNRLRQVVIIQKKQP